MNPKQAAAEQAVTYVRTGMTVGLGTGSTAAFAITALGKMVKEGLSIKGIATSIHSEELAKVSGIPIVSFADINTIDITIDGADECDENLNLVKGGGGALLREKIVAAASQFYIIIVDETKMVKQLGAFPLPVEVIPFGHEMVIKHLIAIEAIPLVRMKDEKVFITDNGNYILDCSFGNINEAMVLHEQINHITGVVENGLFINMADIVIAANDDGASRIIKRTHR